LADKEEIERTEHHVQAESDHMECRRVAASENQSDSKLSQPKTTVSHPSTAIQALLQTDRANNQDQLSTWVTMTETDAVQLARTAELTGQDFPSTATVHHIIDTIV